MESVADAMMLVETPPLKNYAVTLWEERVKTKLCLQAKEEIFITDWWLSPELCLKVLNPKHRKPQKIKFDRKHFLLNFRRVLKDNYTIHFAVNLISSKTIQCQR